MCTVLGSNDSHWAVTALGPNGGGVTMAATTQKTQVEKQAQETANAFVRFWKSSYKVTMEAGEEMSLRALDIPADILEEMGVAEDRAKSFKQFNRKMIGGVYRGLDNMAETVSSGFSAPIEGVSKLLDKLKKRGADEAEKLTKTAKKASKEVKKAAEPAKVEKTVGKTKAKAKKASTAAKKAKGEVVSKTKAAEKKVTQKLAA